MPKSKPTKKVILLIVEGPSDEQSLTLVMDKLIANERVAFEIVHGDILTDKNVNETNVLKRIHQFIEHLTNVRKFCNPKDISRVVHIIDTDGAFIPDDHVTFSSECSIRYTDERIETQDVESIKERNFRKSRMVKKLISTKSISKKNPIPYGIYFFSRNLEHVLHDRVEELNNDEKQRLSEKFEDLYADNPKGFLELICAPEIGTDNEYSASWANIAEGTNSLKRRTNLNIFFNEYLNEKHDSI